MRCIGHRRKPDGCLYDGAVNNRSSAVYWVVVIGDRGGGSNGRVSVPGVAAARALVQSMAH